LGNKRSSQGLRISQKEKREVLPLSAIFLERQAEKYLLGESSLICEAAGTNLYTTGLLIQKWRSLERVTLNGIS
jgi:hypothetical protein